jgi:hypothetical protein
LKINKKPLKYLFIIFNLEKRGINSVDKTLVNTPIIIENLLRPILAKSLVFPKKQIISDYYLP